MFRDPNPKNPKVRRASFSCTSCRSLSPYVHTSPSCVSPNCWDNRAAKHPCSQYQQAVRVRHPHVERALVAIPILNTPNQCHGANSNCLRKFPLTLSLDLRLFQCMIPPKFLTNSIENFPLFLPNRPMPYFCIHAR